MGGLLYLVLLGVGSAVCLYLVGLPLDVRTCVCCIFPVCVGVCGVSVCVWLYTLTVPTVSEPLVTTVSAHVACCCRSAC